MNGTVTHRGDPPADPAHGRRDRADRQPRAWIYKEHKDSTRRIDLAVCAIMAHLVAATVGPGLQLFWYEAAS